MSSLSPFKPHFTYHTIFTPALMLAALSAVDEPAAQPIKQKLAAWLLTQKSPAWSFNYWGAGAPERQTLPYPDDLDDTFCALLALYQHDPSLIDEACLGQVVKLLINTESQVGGPYRTWLAGADAPKAWRDIDLAVNSNIAAFLALVAEPLPNLTKLMEEAIAARRFRSPYYPSAYPLVYYLARGYRGPHANSLAQYLLRRQTYGHWGTPLHTALAVTALARLGQTAPCRPAADWLLAQQQADGSWPAEAFCLDPAVQNRTHYGGAAALTTAFVLEALHHQRRALAAESAPVRPAKSRTNRLHDEIVAGAEAEMKSLGPQLRRTGLTLLAQTQEGTNGREIVGLPALFHASLAGRPPLSATLLRELGLANLYGWMAYTIYDDFLDDEGQTALLPIANVALRASVRHFTLALPRHTAFHKLTAQTFDIIDEANAWEVARGRFAVTPTSITIGKLPRYGNGLGLANRSRGHTLTPLGVLAAAGHKLDSPPVVAIERALRHYLAARQLNDDLHDWEPDLRRGHITFVVAALLHDLALTPRTHKLSNLLPRLQRHFWHHTLPQICTIITHHTTQARAHAAKSQLLNKDNIITQLANTIDRTVASTLEEQTKAERFLTSYRR